MTALVSVETVLLVLLIVLVVGLLRSHAELLRRLGPGDGPAGSATQVAAASPAVPAAPRRDPGAIAPSLTGTTPAGDAVSLSFGDGASTLLAFLTTGCTTCAGFWGTLGERRLPEGTQTVIVAHGAEREQPARLRKLAPAGVPVVMSSAASGGLRRARRPLLRARRWRDPRRGCRHELARAELARRRRDRGSAARVRVTELVVPSAGRG